MIVRCPYKSPKGDLENAKRPISVKKIALRLKKVCYKVSLCDNCQRQSCKEFIGQCKNDYSGRGALLLEISDQSDRVAAKSLIFFISFRS